MSTYRILDRFLGAGGDESTLQEIADEVSKLARESLSGEWRAENSTPEVLDALASLIEEQLTGLDDCPRDLEEVQESACAACLKLARNLSATGPDAQGHWRKRGIIERLSPLLRKDLVREKRRSKVWLDMVVTFLTNAVAGNAHMSTHVLTTMFPYGLAAAFAMCFHKPHMAFTFAQNLFATSDEGSSIAGDLLLSSDGLVVLLFLVSLLQGAEGQHHHLEGTTEEEAAALEAKAKEWATIFFHGLWLKDGFTSAYRGMKSLHEDTIRSFLAQSILPAAVDDERAAATLARIIPQLCSPVEATGWLWHTLHGLVAGPDSTAGSQESLKALAQSESSTASSRELASKLLADEAFQALLREEFAAACFALAKKHKLAWRYNPPSQEACAVLGLSDASQLGVLSAAASDGTEHPPAAEETEEKQEKEETEKLWQTGAGGPYEELLLTALALSSMPRKEVPFPASLAGSLLVSSCELIAALHRLRFGDVEKGAPVNKKPPAEAQEASLDCLLVEQVRLCGNLLFESRALQDFLRLSNQLQVLLSHCYSDPELPLLREVGVFTIRSATLHNLENQEAVRQMLAQRKLEQEQGGRENALPTPQIEEFGFNV